MAVYFDDMEVGAVEHFGSYHVSREEVIEFAAKYDPQPFHLDDEAASHGLFGKLAASGWHTCGMMMNMLVQHWQNRGMDEASMGGAGMDELRWTRPVYPGDTLHCTAELLEKTPSRSKPDRGMTRTHITVCNQNDEPVLRLIALGVWRRRPSGTE